MSESKCTDGNLKIEVIDDKLIAELVHAHKLRSLFDTNVFTEAEIFDKNIVIPLPKIPLTDENWQLLGAYREGELDNTGNTYYESSDHIFSATTLWKTNEGTLVSINFRITIMATIAGHSGGIDDCGDPKNVSCKCINWRTRMPMTVPDACRLVTALACFPKPIQNIYKNFFIGATEELYDHIWLDRTTFDEFDELDWQKEMNPFASAFLDYMFPD